MAKLKIVVGEDEEVLRAMSRPIDRFDNALKLFAKDMKRAMEKAKGMGIAAPQVGKNVRVFWVTLDYKEPNEMCIAMVNPEIVWSSEEKEIDEEGCLSLPGVYGKVERPRAIKVEFFDLDGGRQVLELEGLDARVVQHEKDHLDGVLFIDKLV
jgi:peptide deformylase